VNLLLVVPLVLLALLALWAVVAYDRLVVLRQRIAESWSNVDTELKRRHDLVPNLVETVKGYAAHERQLFDDVTRQRAAAMADAGDTPARHAAEAGLATNVARVLAVAEAYPQLRASENFLRLQRALVDTEDRIQAARRFYNANVRDHNNAVETFPSSVIAARFRFERHAMFELPAAADREPPAVALS
jgi:LemA protein